MPISCSHLSSHMADGSETNKARGGEGVTLSGDCDTVGGGGGGNDDNDDNDDQDDYHQPTFYHRTQNCTRLDQTGPWWN